MDMIIDALTNLSVEDFDAIRLTLRLAGVTTLILLVLATPLSWWLARTSSRWKSLIASLVMLPVVMPPAVLGFYLLVFWGHQGLGGRLTNWLGWGELPFTFAGLVVGSVIYSLPFAVQPLHAAFAQVSSRSLEVAATLGAGPFDRFVSVILPQSRRGLLNAILLAFTHTVGEFGVVMLLGGNIPGQTEVMSMRIYEHVEAMEYGRAHWLAAMLLLFSFVVLLVLHFFQDRRDR